MGSCTVFCNGGGGPGVGEVEVGSCTVFCNGFLGGILSNDSFSV